MAVARTRSELEAGLDGVREAPSESGRLLAIVRRPAIEERELVEHARLDQRGGLVGDNWSVKPASSMPDKSPNPDAQITVMSARAAALVAGSDERSEWAPAGDQLFVDLDLSAANLPPGSRLAVGAEAVLEVTELPHLGCGKFIKRFGVDAMKLVSSEEGRTLRLRGLNARVAVPGAVAVGDAVRTLRAS